MTLPFALGSIPLPDWMPGWLPVVLLIPVVLWLLLLLAMPFAVLGTRSRLEGIEAQLDDLHAELRNLAMQAGGMPIGPPVPRPPAGQVAGAADLPLRVREPRVLPGPERGSEREPVRTREGRAEPRIDWPRTADD